MAENTGILERYSIVLETLAVAPNGLSLSEIVKQTVIPQGTAHRLIKALLKVGYAAQQDSRKIYVLGPRLLRLLHAGISPLAVSSLSRRPLEQLVENFKETAFVAKLTGIRVESVAMVVPAGEAQSYVQPGRHMPINAAASAKAIFAYMDPDTVDAALSEPLTKFLENTHVEKADIIADLETVARNGYAVCVEELDPGVKSFACPVHTGDAGVLYSVGIVGLSRRLQAYPDADITSALRAAADEIATLMRSGQHDLTVVDGGGRMSRQVLG
jgi:DNA-binding IclR family transcriptional regulator